MTNLDNVLEVANRAAKNAAELLMQYFRSENTIEYKTSWNLVSEADVKAEAAITETILGTFPNHTILGEESADQMAKKLGGAELAQIEHLWIVDPLDGTNNFCHGIDQFAVSIAYYHQGNPAVGVVYRPPTCELFEAVKGNGAFVNGKRQTAATVAKLSEALIAVGFYYDRGQQMRATLAAIERLFDLKIRGIRRMGAASLDLCMVGQGQFGGYFEYTLAPWDYAAGKLFVEEAGGVVTDLKGDSFSHGHSGIVAGSAGLHGELLKTVGEQLQNVS